MGNVCTHGVKKTTRKVAETTGVKKANLEPTHDEEIVAMKKEVELGSKNIDRLIKQTEGATDQYLAVGRYAGKYHNIFDTMPLEYRENPNYGRLQVVDNELSSIPHHLNQADDAQIKTSLALLRKYVHECDKTTNIEWKMFNDARVDVDMYRDKLKKNMSANKRDENQMKLEKNEETFLLRREGLKDKLQKLYNVLPRMYETAVVAVCTAYSVQFKTLPERIAAIKQIGSDPEGKLNTTFESLDLTNLTTERLKSIKTEGVAPSDAHKSTLEGVVVPEEKQALEGTRAPEPVPTQTTTTTAAAPAPASYPVVAPAPTPPQAENVRTMPLPPETHAPPTTAAPPVAQPQPQTMMAPVAQPQTMMPPVAQPQMLTTPMGQSQMAPTEMTTEGKPLTAKELKSAAVRKEPLPA